MTERYISFSEIQSPRDSFLRQLEVSILYPNSISFASGKPNCKPTSFACGWSCQPAKTKSGKPTQCKNPLQGQAKTHADWLKIQATSLAKKRREGRKRGTSINYKVDRSDYKALVVLGEQYASSNLKFSPVSKEEKELFKEKSALAKKMLELKQKGSDTEAIDSAIEFLDKEEKYFKEVEKREETDLKQFSRLRQSIKDKSKVDSNTAREIIDSINTKSVNPRHRKNVEADLSELCILTGGKGFNSLGYVTSKSDRAYAGTGVMDVGKKPKRATTAHELGHHIEFESAELQRSAREFRESKATSKTPVPLKEIVQGSDYDDDEIALPGKYIKPYAGKVYSDGSTEIISMGVERFSSAEEMKFFYQNDKDHFYYTLGVLLSED